ncbi:hypothetical protein CJ468_06500 [Nocardia farcinica]|nr:hypothetical protein CJ468_06500 [Nocardia farcinica]
MPTPAPVTVMKQPISQMLVAWSTVESRANPTTSRAAPVTTKLFHLPNRVMS